MPVLLTQAETTTGATPPPSSAAPEALEARATLPKATGVRLLVAGALLVLIGAVIKRLRTVRALTPRPAPQDTPDLVVGP